MVKPKQTKRTKRCHHETPHTQLSTTTIQYKVRSDKMAELVKQYHDNLQEEGLNDPTSPEFSLKITKVLEEILEGQKFRSPETSELNQGIMKDVVTEALRLSKNGSATGLDGCPYELWKELKK